MPWRSVPSESNEDESNENENHNVIELGAGWRSRGGSGLVRLSTRGGHHLCGSAHWHRPIRLCRSLAGARTRHPAFTVIAAHRGEGRLATTRGEQKQFRRWVESPGPTATGRRIARRSGQHNQGGDSSATESIPSLVPASDDLFRKAHARLRT